MKVENISDSQYVASQYSDASNLDARIRLHRQFSTNQYGWQRWIFDQLAFVAHSHVLEIGCGPGDLWIENSDRMQAGWEITLSDFSPGMLQQARQRLSTSQITRYCNLDAQAIPFPDRCFDAVIANHMLYHVPDRERALAEIRRVLKPDGVFYASTLGARSMKEIADLPARFDPQLAGWREPLNITFTLEDGADQLRHWFTDVTLRRYEDALIVTQSAPLVDYILSGRVKIPADRREAFAQFVEAELQRRGGKFYITKDSGLFLSRL